MCVRGYSPPFVQHVFQQGPKWALFLSRDPRGRDLHAHTCAIIIIIIALDSSLDVIIIIALGSSLDAIIIIALGSSLDAIIIIDTA